MKKTASIIASVLLIAVLVSALMINVYAANVSMSSFSKYVYPWEFGFVAEARLKEDSSDMVIHIETATNASYYIQAVSCNSAQTTFTNCTLLGGAPVDHVIIQRGTVYSVESSVFNNDYTYCAFRIRSVGNPGNASGYWAPNSVEEFAEPSA